ncbi:MAG: acyl-CoA thioesterase [Bacteroidia bacterium]
MFPPGYNTSVDLKIDWSDLDLFGHINNVAFFKYIQSARVNYCESIGLTSINEENKLSFIVAAINCSFKTPLRYPGNVKVYTKTDWIKNSSLQLSHVLVDDKGQVTAESTDVLVIFDYTKKIKTTVPSELKLQIEQRDNKKF